MTQPAGWYADPSGLPARRWWDGRQWTDHVQPGGAPMPPPNGYFPPVPPSGPVTPGAHTDLTGRAESPSYASQPAVFQQSGPPARPVTPVAPPPEARAAHPEAKSPAPHPEVPVAPYAMPPADKAPFAALGSSAPATAVRDNGLTRQQRTAGFAGLALIAVVVLILTAVVLLA